jgi:hypothetical protein
MAEPPEGPPEPGCRHGVPQTMVCPECIGDIVRQAAGIAAARQAGAAPTPLAAGAIQSHEMLLAHIAAGFTRAEAMQIVLMIYAVSIFRAPPQ